MTGKILSTVFVLVIELFLIVALAHLLTGCSSEGDGKCRSSARTLGWHSQIECTPGARVRVEPVGDGKLRRSMVVCDCVQTSPDMKMNTDMSTKTWR